ncbi:putative extracellular nuclease, EndA/NucM family protein [Mycoplasmopsis canis UF31]|uniref:endonuclease n=1 Tax=Mycoplasmopsis canis TaxID=29555 RepID=UPI00025ACFB3|nr:endonuclease [Mycoplasmopsis canis]EIE40056.1 putative extracellular nuclease, EndA/NucM family protein [Mycoplasmopsis canis UF31]
MKKISKKILGILPIATLGTTIVSCSPKQQENNNSNGESKKEKALNLINFIPDGDKKIELLESLLKAKTVEEIKKIENIFLEKQTKKYVYDNNNDYYSRLDGKSGTALLDELVKLQTSKLSGIKTYNDLKSFYDSSEAFKDRYFENDGSILDIYSEDALTNDPYNYETYANKASNPGKNEGEGMNREHVIPQSWFGKQEPTRSDAHFVWPTDIKVNAIRGNFPHGNVKKIKLLTKNNGKLGQDSGGIEVFEPIDVFKGDIARAYFYFIVTHKQNLKFDNQKVFKSVYPFIEKKFLDYYLSWNTIDPISKWDIKRNEEIYKYQNNRNPFTDYPNLIFKIIGADNTPFINKGVLIDVKDN